VQIYREQLKFAEKIGAPAAVREAISVSLSSYRNALSSEYERKLKNNEFGKVTAVGGSAVWEP
jgi:hypothetical protein